MPQSKEFENLSLQLCEWLKLLGINAKMFDLENDIELEKSDVVLALSSDLNCECYKNFFNEYSTKNLKIINVLSEKDRNQKDIFGINLYHLDGFNFDKTLCIEILLKSIYLGILAKCSEQ